MQGNRQVPRRSARLSSAPQAHRNHLELPESVDMMQRQLQQQQHQMQAELARLWQQVQQQGTEMALLRQQVQQQQEDIARLKQWVDLARTSMQGGAVAAATQVAVCAGASTSACGAAVGAAQLAHVHVKLEDLQQLQAMLARRGNTTP